MRGCRLHVSSDFAGDADVVVDLGIRGSGKVVNDHGQDGSDVEGEGRAIERMSGEVEIFGGEIGIEYGHIGGRPDPTRLEGEPGEIDHRSVRGLREGGFVLEGREEERKRTRS